MWPTRGDFRIQASNFDLTNGLNILRIICGLFLFPHDEQLFV
jgi:putative oxidoreductase